jgi:plasmid stability protein
MQYTLRNVPKVLDRALRERAKREGKSLNQVALDALMRAIGAEAEATPHRSLADVGGTWIADAEVDRALDDQRAVDPDLWR